MLASTDRPATDDALLQRISFPEAFDQRFGFDWLLYHLAGACLKVRTGTVVYQDQVAAAADERDIGLDWRTRRIAAELRQYRPALFRRRVGKQDFGGQGDEAVADDSDIEGAVRKTIGLRRIGAARQDKGRRAREGAGQKLTARGRQAEIIRIVHLLVSSSVSP